MLISFTCDAYADITMFGDVAKHLLGMMGHSGEVPGAILADEVPAALQRLKTALAEEVAEAAGEPAPEADDDEDRVSLAHRALPLVELLEAAARESSDVMWSAR